MGGEYFIDNKSEKSVQKNRNCCFQHENSKKPNEKWEIEKFIVSVVGGVAVSFRFTAIVSKYYLSFGSALFYCSSFHS